MMVLRLWLQIRYVKGIDLSPGEIEEAKQRLQQVQRKYGVCPTSSDKLMGILSNACNGDSTLTIIACEYIACIVL